MTADDAVIINSCKYNEGRRHIANKWNNDKDCKYLKRARTFALHLRKYLTPRKFHIAKDTLIENCNL